MKSCFSSICFGIAICIILVALNGCAGRKTLVAWTAKPMIEEMIESIMAEHDVELAKEAMETGLKLLDGFVQMDPDDKDLLQMATHGYAGYSMLFVEPDNPERAAQFYERARIYGLRGLTGGKSIKYIDDMTWNEFQAWTGKFKNSDLPLVYWTAAAWASRINLSRTSTEALSQSPRAVAMMQWVVERQPNFFYSAPLWFFGTYYCSLPPMLGGGSEKARNYFNQAIYAHGDQFLWGKLLYAQNFAVITLDKKLFESTLKSIVNSNIESPNELKLLNAVAKQRAKKLLSDGNKYF